MTWKNLWRKVYVGIHPVAYMDTAGILCALACYVIIQ